MDEKNKFEINDEMLNEVSGGGNFPSNVEHRVGETFRRHCLNRGCQKYRRISTVVITEIIDENTAKLKMACCGMERIGYRNGQR